MVRTTGTSVKGSKPRSAANANEKTNINPRRSPRKRGHANLAEESDEEQQQPKLKTPSRSRTRKRSQAKAKNEPDLVGANSPPEKSAGDDEDAFDPEVHDEEGDLGIVRKGRKNIEYDSDALDEEEDHKPKPSKKRKRGSDATSTPSPTKAKAPKRKKRKVVDEDEDDEDDDLKEGQEVVGVVVQAPKTGQVPPGQISKNTFNFLSKLADPACNDREWFKLHEPVYRLAEKEWKDFVEKFTDLLIEVDDQIPPLPPRDVIHRIYRDIRFSNDKTPYKRSFSASFSRSGRKGIFAAYHIVDFAVTFFSAIRPGGESLIAGGSWCPGRNELATIRTNLLRDSQPLRDIIESSDFVKYFGEAKSQPNGERSNIFGAEDELKVAPKGVEKTHPDIDLLKCRSFAVLHRFLDSEVLAPDFRDKLAQVANVLQPFVRCLNDLMTLQDNDDDN
ncbi:hypothetical protein VNI00_009468 [Paramarasmius palmivorus]|uniref:Uncharacterized protein n=1 Tax=Paramarasmius palmivorus TaxID=297713 RepID=A0AAW0CRT7_9AGAR